MASVTFTPATGGNGSTVDDTPSTTTGLAAGGFRTRLVPAFTNIVNTAQMAVTKAGEASSSAAAALSSASSAAMSPSTNASSATSLTIGLGSKSLTIETGKNFVVGMYIAIASSAAPVNTMYGQVTSYTSGTGALVVNVTQANGSGTIAAWSVSLSGPAAAALVSVTPVSVSTQTSATDITLNNTSAGLQTIAMTVMGKSVQLPSATTMTSVGGQVFVIRNSGGYPFGVRDSSGALLTGISPGGIAYLTLESMATAVGAWGITGANLEPGLITLDSTFSGTYTSTVQIPFAALDANTSIHFAALTAGGFVAFVVDNLGKVISTPVTVTTVSGSAPQTAFRINATQAIVFYTAVTGQQNACVITLSGASPNYTLAIGVQTQAAITMNGKWDGETFIDAPKIAQLSGSLYVFSYSPSINAGFSRAFAITVSGTTVIFGVPVSLGSTLNEVVQSTTTYALTATTALVIFLSNGAAPYAVSAVVVSVSGSTCTVGAIAAGNTVGTTSPPFSCLLSPTKAIVALDNNQANIQVQAITIAGTVVSFGLGALVETIVGPLSQYSATSATRYNPHLSPLSANSALLWYMASSGARVVAITESAGTLTVGPLQYRAFENSGMILNPGTSEFVTLSADGPGSANNNKYRAVPYKITGTTLTVGSGAVLSELPSVSSAIYYNFTRLASGDYVIPATINSGLAAAASIQVLKTNGDAVNFKGSIKAPMLYGGQVPNVIGARVIILGMMVNGSPNVGLNIYQLRLLNVEIAS